MPTVRQELLAEKLVENVLKDKPDNMGQLLESAGYAKQTAEATPGKIINQAGVQEALEERRSELEAALRKRGVTPALIAVKVKNLLDASSPIYKNNNETGEIELVGEKPDYQAMDKGITQAMKMGLGGGYVKETAPPAPGTVNVTFINSPEVQKLIQNFEQSLKEQLTRSQ